MKKLTPSEFCKSFAKAPSESRIVHAGDGMWEARCPAGVLAKPDGETGFSNLPGLLSILAGVGIRRCDVEWDGIPAWYFDRAN